MGKTKRHNKKVIKNKFFILKFKDLGVIKKIE